MGKFTGLAYEALLGTEDKPEYKLAEPAFTWTLSPKEGDPVTIKAGGPIEENFYAVKSSAHPYYLKVRKYQFEKLEKLTRAALVKEKAPEANAVAEGEATKEAATVTEEPEAAKE